MYFINSDSYENKVIFLTMAKIMVAKDMMKKCSFKITNGIQLSKLGFGIGFACLLTMTGCDNSDNKTEGNNKDGKDKVETVGLEAVAPDASKVCADPNLATGLSNYLLNSVQQQSKTFAMAQAQSNNLQLDLDKIGVGSEVINIEVSNVQPVKGTTTLNNGMVSCQATVAMELPTEVITRANAMYGQSNQGSLEQTLSGSDVTLNGTKMVSNAFAFMVDPKSSGIQVTGQPTLLTTTSNVLANSSIKAQLDAQLSAKRAADRKKAQQQAAARRKARQLAEKKRKAQQQAAARKKALAEQKRRAQQASASNEANPSLSLESDGVPFNQANTAPASVPNSNKPLNVKGADDIEVVIVEESGTY